MIALDPNQTFELMPLVLEAELPEAQRTRFVCRYMSWREQLIYDQMTDDANRAKTPRECAETLERAVKMVVKRVTGPQVPASPADPLLGLTITELWEVANAIPPGCRLSEMERKKSVLQSASAAAGKSVEGVPPAQGAV